MCVARIILFALRPANKIPSDFTRLPRTCTTVLVLIPCSWNYQNRTTFCRRPVVLGILTKRASISCKFLKLVSDLTKLFGEIGTKTKVVNAK